MMPRREDEDRKLVAQSGLRASLPNHGCQELEEHAGNPPEAATNGSGRLWVFACQSLALWM